MSWLARSVVSVRNYGALTSRYVEAPTVRGFLCVIDANVRNVGPPVHRTEAHRRTRVMDRRKWPLGAGVVLPACGWSINRLRRHPVYLALYLALVTLHLTNFRLACLVPRPTVPCSVTATTSSLAGCCPESTLSFISVGGLPQS